MTMRQSASDTTTLDHASTAPLQQIAGHEDAADASRLVRLFINRNFAIYTAGSLVSATVSATGSWFQVVALGWLVVSVGGSNSAFLLGLVGFASLIPILLLGLVGGLLADLLDRRL